MATATAEALSSYEQFSGELGKRLATGEDTLAVIVLEACNMPRIEARFGREQRNRQLARLTSGIANAVRSIDFVAHTGEQSFALIVSGLKNRGHATLAARKLLRLTEADQNQPADDFDTIGLRLGMALFPENAGSAPELLRQAQLALEVAKDSGSEFVIYDEENVARTAVSWDLKDELAEAVRDGGLDVHYQPKINMQTGIVCGAEALVRWFSEKRGTVSPGKFMPVAEGSELIEPLTRFVLNSAMRNMMMWQRDGHDIGVAVNLPPSMLLDSGIVCMVESLMSIWDIRRGRLTLELTESAIMADPDTCFATMASLKELGCRISIDDFGTGYSSFSYFKSIPADELKIDRAFIANMRRDTADQRIVQAIVGLAHAFDMHVVAEGIEDRETLRMLRRLQCDTGQGYFIAKPMSQEDYDGWLDAKRYAQPDI